MIRVCPSWGPLIGERFINNGLTCVNIMFRNAAMSAGRLVRRGPAVYVPSPYLINPPVVCRKCLRLAYWHRHDVDTDAGRCLPVGAVTATLLA